MKSVRIEPVNPDIANTLFVDVVCDCGKNGLKNEAGHTDFKHMVTTVAGEPDKLLSCECGRKYLLHPQNGHIHIFNA